ncbi:MAG: ABC transporter permease [Spirochaetales bacterium]|nr:ABC transporter permease [Spirochaetales bacterium]
MIRYLRFITKRLILLLFVLFGLSLMTFLLARVVPSDPAATYLGPRPQPEQVERIRAQMGLDRPLPVQYALYLRDLLSGDFGTSLSTHQPVLASIREYLPASLELMITAMAIALAVGLFLGTLSARHENTLIDHTGRFIAITGVSLPAFWLGLLLQILFFRVLGILPLGGRIDTMVSLIHPVKTITGFLCLDSLLTGNWTAFRSALLHLILPACTLAAYSIGIVTRMTRSSLLEVAQEEFVTAARAEGFSERRIAGKYMLKNALGPTFTSAGLAFASMLTGTFYIEAIFYWPGLGSYTANAILSIDYPVIMGVTLLGAVFYVVVNLLVDILISFIDPRIRI